MHRVARTAALALAMLGSSCAILPRELNLSPLWFHRLDEDGKVLEADALWPIVHYERTPQGGDDFRIRPLWRRITEPEVKAVEHQFLWPLGRLRTDQDGTSNRLFPLWSWRQHENEKGELDTDWYAIFPLLWGGHTARGDEDYFAFLPFYGDIPDFLTYDRFQTVLFPLYVRLDKEGHRHFLFVWPLIGVSSCAEGPHDWFRVFPIYGHDIDTGKHERHFAIWPILSWSTENIDTDDPVDSWWIWPIYGERSSRRVAGVSILWPLFEKLDREDGYHKLNVLWPLFHYYRDETSVDKHVTQWWLWPIVGHAKSDDEDNWSFAWPLIWWRDYHDPDGRTRQEWVLPFFWHVGFDGKDGSTEDFLKLWPFAHRTTKRDADGKEIGGDWSVLSPIPWRDGNNYGVEEMYGFLWELAHGRRRGPDDHAVDLVARAYSRRERAHSTTASVPFLFNYESDDAGRTLRLFQFLPIGLGKGDSSK